VARQKLLPAQELDMIRLDLKSGMTISLPHRKGLWKIAYVVDRGVAAYGNNNPHTLLIEWAELIDAEIISQ
jgi:hypothetical protein